MLDKLAQTEQANRRIAIGKNNKQKVNMESRQIQVDSKIEVEK